MTLTEAKKLADDLKVLIGKTMKPYDAPVVSIQVVPNDIDQIYKFINILCFTMGKSDVLKTYPKNDYTIAIFFDELNLWNGVRWSSYEQFAFQNNL